MTSPALNWLRKKMEALYPSVESLTMTQVDFRLSLLNGIALSVVIIVTLGGLFGGIWWDGYKDRLSERKATLEKLERQTLDLELKAQIAEAKRRAESSPEVSGTITPGNGETPPLSDFIKKQLELHPIPESSVLFFLGSNVFWSDTFPHTIITHAGDDIITVGMNSNTAWLTAKFFNAKDEIICRIEKNKFTRNIHNTFRMSHEDHRLRIFDNQDRAVFDLEFINPRTIRVLGDFYLHHGYPIVLTRDHCRIGDMDAFNNMFGRGLHIEPIPDPTPDNIDLFGMIGVGEPLVSFNAKVELHGSDMPARTSVMLGNYTDHDLAIIHESVGIFTVRAGSDIKSFLKEFDETTVERILKTIIPSGWIGMRSPDFPLTKDVYSAIENGTTEVYCAFKFVYLDQSTRRTLRCLYKYNASEKRFVADKTEWNPPPTGEPAK